MAGEHRSLKKQHYLNLIKKPKECNVSRLLSYCSSGTSWNGIWLVAISGSEYIVIGMYTEREEQTAMVF